MDLKKAFSLVTLLLLVFITADFYPQTKIVDDFESIDDWETISSDGVDIQLSQSEGIMGKSAKLDFNFVSGAGYGGFQKTFPLELPENFQFSFYIKADAPSNNLEFKLIDESGDNVWWKNQINFEFPRQWKKITIKKRNIEFAWGPAQDKNLKKVYKLQFMIASFNGGKGSVYFDNFKFEPLEGIADTLPVIQNIEVSTNMHDAANLFDGKASTFWRSAPADNQSVIIDLGARKELGGLIIDWDEKSYAEKYNILLSNDKAEWEKAYTVNNGKGGRAYISLSGSESRYIKLDLLESSGGKGYTINEIKTEGYKFTETPETFMSNIAKDKPQGYFPKYIYNTQSYWTITGVNADEKEALINEEGMVEVDKRSFSIEPFIYMDGKLITWKDAKYEQGLEDEYLPIPIVKRNANGLELETKIFAAGEPGKSVLYIRYILRNASNSEKRGNLFLALRPFQVNPTWQFLNLKGGMTRIESIQYADNHFNVNGEKQVIALTNPDNYGAAEFDNGDILDYISRDTLPDEAFMEDHTGFGSAALQYEFNIPAGESKAFYLAVPFYKDEELLQVKGGAEAAGLWEKRFQENKEYWKNKLNTVQFNLPKDADKIIKIVKSNLAYILINKDKAGIQPGSRSYDRSWIRDGSLTSSALLKLGITKEPNEFITWYSKYQYENGKVPCVVDRRGADPTPENDSHGQLIFALMQYYNFTKDTTLLRERFGNVEAAINYMNYLRGLRRTEEFKSGEKKLFYGLLPESISHEGYSAKPMHSYWDDFFALKGYKDAVEIARILGMNEKAKEFVKARDEFETDLYNSINLSIQTHKIDYIPGCAELGDFDATST
ncbi:MAG TPA: discoidin domain-containing protein, partial [Ignavibacteriales bacterium]|nr:discoidin domain-containing protein [Ignavibacteriales bacterium]